MARPSAAIYRRRRAAALLAVVAVVLCVLLLATRLGDGSDRLLSVADVKRLQRAQEPVHLTLSFSGDLLIHSPVWARALALGGGGGYDFAPLFDELRPYVADADLAFCHVETPMTPAPPASYPIFNTPPALAQGVAENGWDVCDTASNHSLDQGQEGIAATGRALDAAGIEHTGSFASPREQRRPLLVQADGVRIAYLAYTTDTNGIPLPAEWSVNIASPERIVEDARRARRAGADAVIVNVHWGGQIVAEYATEPSPAQEDFARKLLEAPQITAVVGQGPHVVQPIERIAGKYVVFSEGNLVSNQGAEAGLPENSQDGYVALLEMVADGKGARVESVSYVPVWVRHPDYEVLAVGPALQRGEADAATLQASYQRTVDVAGDGRGVTPVPAKLP